MVKLVKLNFFLDPPEIRPPEYLKAQVHHFFNPSKVFLDAWAAAISPTSSLISSSQSRSDPSHLLHDDGLHFQFYSEQVLRLTQSDSRPTDRRTHPGHREVALPISTEADTKGFPEKKPVFCLGPFSRPFTDDPNIASQEEALNWNMSVNHTTFL